MGDSLLGKAKAVSASKAEQGIHSFATSHQEAGSYNSIHYIYVCIFSYVLNIGCLLFFIYSYND